VGAELAQKRLGRASVKALFVIDTAILIDVAREVTEAVLSLQHLEQHTMLAISVIPQMELIVGCRNALELRKLNRFLRRFQVVELNGRTSSIALDLLRRYRLSHGLLIADGLIAAMALALETSFVTKNKRDYRFITELHLLAYPQMHPNEV
jgi:predicted nucleic acid-binding protein